ncbi:MAG TPA: hypothetical protein VND64_29295 [Pirellulales bacterium]|nr:hypothetical protein [Pirellulales bacterium]
MDASILDTIDETIVDQQVAVCSVLVDFPLAIRRRRQVEGER